MVPHTNIIPALRNLRNTISQITNLYKTSDLHTLISSMDLSDLNKVLYRCDQEEREETANKFGVYNVPGYGPLVYAGLQGDNIIKYMIICRIYIYISYYIYILFLIYLTI